MTTEWEKHFVNYVSGKDLVSRIYKEQLNNKKANISILKWEKDLNRLITKEDM